MKQETLRTIAAKAGKLTYTTGKLCKHGHMAPRSTITSACVECSKRSTNDRNNEVKAILRAALERGPDEIETVPAPPPKKKAKIFSKPTIPEIAVYCDERRNSVSAVRFFDYYESNGWRVGKSPMKNWQAAVRTWEQNGSNGNGKTQQHSKPSLAERATNARKEYERSIGLGDTVRAIDGEFVGTYEPPVRT